VQRSVCQADEAISRIAPPETPTVTINTFFSSRLSTRPWQELELVGSDAAVRCGRHKRTLRGEPAQARK
jgi:hypothetical protein